MDEVNTKPAKSGITRDKKGRFPKGVSGNPAGKPVGTVSIVEGIRRKLLEVDPVTRRPYMDIFLSTLFQKAAKEGNEQLMRDMINRIDGMPKQTTDVTTNGKEIKTVLVEFLDGSKSNSDTS